MLFPFVLEAKINPRSGLPIVTILGRSLSTEKLPRVLLNFFVVKLIDCGEKFGGIPIPPEIPLGTNDLLITFHFKSFTDLVAFESALRNFPKM